MPLARTDGKSVATLQDAAARVISGIEAQIPVNSERYAPATRPARALAQDAIIVPEGDVLTVQRNHVAAEAFRLAPNSRLRVPYGITLDLRGSVDAGRYQVFDGDGTVLLSDGAGEAYPEWFGAVPDGATDCYAPLQKTIDSGCGRISLAPDTYLSSGATVYPQVNFGGTTPRRPLVISGNGATLRRSTSSLSGALNPILYLYNLYEYSTTVNTRVVPLSHQITVASAASMSEGDILLISSTEPYGTRDGAATPYYKGFSSRIIDISGSNVVLADPVPYEFLLSKGGDNYTISVYGWTTRCPITVRDLHLEFNAIAALETQGIHCEYGNDILIENCSTKNVTLNGVAVVRGYNTRISHCRLTSPSQSPSLELEYGVHIGNSTRVTVEHCDLRTARHSVVLTGQPPYLCEVAHSFLGSDYDASAQSFDAHCAERVVVRSCTMNDGITIAGGHFEFYDNDIYTRQAHATGIIKVKDLTFLKSCTVDKNRIHMMGGNPGQSASRGSLYNLGTSQLGVIDHGPLKIVNNDIYNESSQLHLFTRADALDAGGGTYKQYTLPYYFDNSSSGIVVYKRDTSTDAADTALTLTTDYTLSGATTPGGGTINLVLDLGASERLVVCYMPAAALIIGYDWDDTPTSFGDVEIIGNRFYGLWGSLWSFTGSYPTSLIASPGNLIVKDNIGDFGLFGTDCGLWRDITVKNNRRRTPMTNALRPPYLFQPHIYLESTLQRDYHVEGNIGGGIGVYSSPGNVVVKGNTVEWQFQGAMPLSGNTLVVLRDNTVLRAPTTGSACWGIGSSTVKSAGNIVGVSGYVLASGTATAHTSPEMYHAGSGATGSRPTVRPIPTSYFDTTVGTIIFWDGSNWVDATGATV